MDITKDMLISDILEKDQSIAGVLMNMGMHCIGCMAASGESLEQAMYVHGFPEEAVDKTVEMLNEIVASKKTE
ncbi:MAG: DUF1858 domain-containing protein [Clostridiales bacterium]|nr:DUF1858 domain-containing protein [Clostridiales bacterium]